MMKMMLDPKTDLELVRELKAPPSKVWRCWTEPALIERWFAPRPVVTRDVSIELVAGGSFKTTMDVPDHGTMVGHGCILEVEHERRLVWTDLMQGGFRPNADCFGFTAMILLEPKGTGTLYRALALHRKPEDAENHAKMGFHEGWGTAAAQLDEVALTL